MDRKFGSGVCQEVKPCGLRYSMYNWKCKDEGYEPYRLPCEELPGHEVVVGADQLEGPFGQPFLDEGVSLEVGEGHVHGLLQKHSEKYKVPFVSKINSLHSCNACTYGVRTFSRMEHWSSNGTEACSLCTFALAGEPILTQSSTKWLDTYTTKPNRDIMLGSKKKNHDTRHTKRFRMKLSCLYVHFTLIITYISV